MLTDQRSWWDSVGGLTSEWTNNRFDGTVEHRWGKCRLLKISDSPLSSTGEIDGESSAAAHVVLRKRLQVETQTNPVLAVA